MADYQFGNRLAAIRLASGYSQFQIGHLVGVSDKAVSKWETGQAKPRLAVCKKLAAIFGVSIDILLNSNEEPVVSDAEQKKRELWETVRGKLYEKFGPKPHAAFLARFESEKIALEASDIIFHMNAAATVIQATRSKNNQLFSGYTANGSFVAWLWGIDTVNPLPPYVHCPRCHYTALHPEVRDGWDLPEQVCPECGQVMERDGHGVPFAEFAYRATHDLDKQRALSVPQEHLHSCKALLERAYAGIYRVQPFDTAFHDMRMNPEHNMEESYILLPLHEPQPKLAEDGYLVIDYTDKAQEKWLKQYNTIKISDNYPFDQERVLSTFEQNDTVLHAALLQDQSLYEAYWKKQCERNPENKVMSLHRIDPENVDLLAEAERLKPHTVAWNSIAELLGNTPIHFSTLVKASMIFAKGDWENRYHDELQSGHFSFMDIPTEPEDVYKRIISKITPDACVGMDFVLRIIVEMREGKYLEAGIDEETRSILSMLGLEDWYIDFMEKLNPFADNGEEVINSLLAELAILWLEQHLIDVETGAGRFSLMKDRISMSTDSAPTGAKEELLAALKERQKRQSATEILADLMKYIFSGPDDDTPFK